MARVHEHHGSPLGGVQTGLDRLSVDPPTALSEIVRHQEVAGLLSIRAPVRGEEIQGDRTWS